MIGAGSMDDRMDWLMPRAATPLVGSESFVGIVATCVELWRSSCRDFRDYTSRGVLAAFLVAKAVGYVRGKRIGWANYDVETEDGTTIEVKSSAFLQSWGQRQHSRLAFGRLKGRTFDADRNEYGEEPEVRADIFVFAVQTQQDPTVYDMLDVRHWEFWVVRADKVREAAYKSVGIGWVKQHADVGPMSFDELGAAVQALCPVP